MSRRFLLLALALCPALAQAQAHPLVGQWDISLVAGMRIENGEQVPINAKASLNIAVEGDSLVATLKTEPVEGRPARPPARFAAKTTAGKVVFVQKSDAKLNMNGEEMTRTMVSTYTMEASGDALTGTISREIVGMEMPVSPQPLSGTRAKN